MSNQLKDFKILLADADRQLANVLKVMLAKMGFTNVRHTQSGDVALQLLQSMPFDFLITDWNTHSLDGISLIDRIRHSTDSHYMTLPIIMLTGRAEQSDVVTARDHGINEYVVKPFSAKTVYSRLERLLEHPRNFVLSKSFVGPDRRNKGTPPPGISERRVREVKPQAKSSIQLEDIIKNNTAKVWNADYALKEKLGENTTLASLITPAVLNLAQLTIESITSDSLQWIKDNLTELKHLYLDMVMGQSPDTIANDMAEMTLTINSRAGTFGYVTASEVAYLLYLFCRNQLDPKLGTHHIVVDKHISVLQVILSKNLRGTPADHNTEIINELRHLAKKYTA